jgi:hypothetical protein
LQEKPSFGSYFTMRAIVAAGKDVGLEDTHEGRVLPLVTVCQIEELAFFIGCFGRQAVCDRLHIPGKLLGEEMCFR